MMNTWRDPQDDAATLAMLKHHNPDHDRIWRAWDDLGRKGNRNGPGAVRLLDAADGAGTMNATPGPWVAKARPIGGYNIVAIDDVLVELLVGIAPLGDHAFETARDNARLLAAAPRLLAELKRARNMLNEYELYQTGESFNDTELNSAIAEAEPQP